ncbi:MAG: endonuclease MutS2 [Oscillospiraceae bacterium]|nr:endonuclease MutS2 [Oscillospiraceae bacterium]
MMDLFEKSQQTLELPAVLELLAAEAVSEPAKELVRALMPSLYPEEIRRRLGETTAAKDMMVTRGSPAFSGVRDVRGALARADMGGVLNTRELLQIAGVLTAARSVRSYGMGAEKSSCLDSLFSTLQANKFLEDKIVTSIPAEDEIADAASSELADIRRKMRAAAARVRDSLQKIISAPSMAKFLQDPIITTRSDRFVVPVKAECKGSVPGLVHDVSASGATVFVEPMAAVKANNEIRELKAREKAEEERILAELSADCAEHRESIDADYAVLVNLDSIFARAKLSFKLNAGPAELSEKGIRLLRARHPLLDKDKAVPIDVELGEDYDTLVITGPNTGGKTVTLKTIGLLCLMTQCGLHIPASDGSRVPVFERVLADIGDEQSIEQSLSTFSSHMVNIVGLLKECGERTLLLFDELGAGTDPTEGAALAVAILEDARRRGAVIAATTHYSELKVYATNTPGVMNASCEFDVDTLRPTYRLLLGIPGKSNAFAISQRLGLPEEIIADARERVGASGARFEETIEKLEEARRILDRDRQEAAVQARKAREEREQAEKLRLQLQEQLDKAEDRARREAKRILADARGVADATFRELDQMRSEINEAQDHQRVNEARAELRRRLNEAEEVLRGPEIPQPEEKSARPIRVGDVVQVRSMGVKATVTAIDADRVLSLQAGILQLSAREDEVLLLQGEKPRKSEHRESRGVSLRSASVPSELDIRGMDSLEAIPVVERYIDSASQGRMETVTIIHGKGTGALRAAVQQSLRKNKQVKSFRLGRYGEGETGVTIVELK